MEKLLREEVTDTAGVLVQPLLSYMVLYQGVLTQPQSLDDSGEVEECEEDDVEFVEAGEDTAEAFESAEEPFYLIASAIHGFVVLPGIQSVALGRNDWDEAKIQSQLAGLVILVGPVHE